MKILQIRLKNLNSLVGEWTINLTDAAYISSGIFAITGPTGAGKSTILDAICLALYGCTPRLGRLTQEKNDILSRQSGECFAEVLLETQAGQFRCNWSQRRAHGRSNGELQAPKHEVAEALTGKLLASKLTETRAALEEIIGMDFERFTRSVLLAQGGFAAFLLASSSERSPILEEITGTEIYGELSIAIHERHSLERSKLDALGTEIKGLSVLNPQEESALQAQLSEQQTQLSKLQAELTVAVQAQVWLSRLAELEQSVTDLEKAHLDSLEKLQQFDPANQRRLLSHKARDLEPAWTRCDGLRRDQSHEQQELTEVSDGLTQSQEKASAAIQAVVLAQSRLNTAKSDFESQLPLLRQATELDQTILAEMKLYNRLIGEHKTQTDLGRGLDNEVSNNKEALQDLNFEIERLAKALSPTESALVENITALVAQLQSLSSIRAQQAQKSSESQNLATKVHLAQDAENVATKKATTTIDQINQLVQAQAALQKERANLLAEKSPSQLRSDQATLIDAIHQCETLTKVVEDLEETQTQQIALMTAERKWLSEQTQVDALLLANQQTQEALSAQVELLEQQLLLARTVQSFAEARHLLIDGEPCPVCGALEHPWATEQGPKAGELESQLQSVQSSQKKNLERLTQLALQRNSLEKDLSQNLSHQNEAQLTIKALETQLTEGLLELGISTKLAEASTALDGLEADQKVRQTDLARKIERLDQIDQKNQQVQQSLEQHRADRQALEAETHKAITQRLLLEQAYSQAQSESERLAEKIKQEIQQVATELVPYNIPYNDAVEELIVIKTLTTRQNRWQDDQQKKSELELRRVQLETQHTGTLQQLDEITKRLANLDIEVQSSQENLSRLRNERQNLVGEVNPKVEEETLMAAITAAEKRLHDLQALERTATEAFQNLVTHRDQLKQSLERRGTELALAENAFQTQLLQQGLKDEQDFLQARLPDEQRKELDAVFDRLDDQRKQQATNLETTRSQLAEHRLAAVTTLTADNAQSTVLALKQREQELHQQRGALQHRLHEDSERRLQQKARQADYEAQKLESERWTRLHALIGSADGKKFRNFAQGLTFEIMISHANVQLQKMTDRYRLVQASDDLLDLAVFDHYQAGEIRSARNLSGGESFLVSLALALGLSQMASHKVRVDSLFLDEGFGTLDEDALDTALSALSSLQQDGKMIGLISHVGAIKERISAQIVVTPISGGRSQIQGPGILVFSSSKKNETNLFTD